MTTSEKMSLSSVISLRDELIPPFELGYLKASARDKAYESFVNAFLKEQQASPWMTRAFLARRSGKSPEQITRYLSSPGNWTIDTHAVLCAAIGLRPIYSVEKLVDLRLANDCHQLVSDCAQDDVSGIKSKPVPVLIDDFSAQMAAQNALDAVKGIVMRQPFAPGGTKFLNTLPVMGRDQNKLSDAEIRPIQS